MAGRHALKCIWMPRFALGLGLGLGLGHGLGLVLVLVLQRHGGGESVHKAQSPKQNPGAFLEEHAGEAMVAILPLAISAFNLFLLSSG